MSAFRNPFDYKARLHRGAATAASIAARPISLGAGFNPIPWTMPAVENINGQAITLSIKHKDKRDPRDWKGFRFAVPFDYSMHNYRLRYYLAEHGIDPDGDVSIRSVPPPEMVANLRADNIDGFLAPDPVNQRAVYDGVGFIHLLSKEIWDGHPCCAFSASREFVTTMPNTYQALLKAILDATAYARKAENRKEIAVAIAPTNYLNQPVTVVEQVLTGTFADGPGNVVRDPNRMDFDPFPYQSFAIRRSLAMDEKRLWLAPLLSLVFLAVFVGLWHLGTRTTVGEVIVDPEYAALIGAAAATGGQSAMPGPGDVAGKLWVHLSDPFYVHGTTFKELIHEEFGDGIMSAIDFRMDLQREPNPAGDRVSITMSGKFLPYKTY
ncbi:ABC transporter substrate-binding protein [Rhodocyclaceae bacterium SMB388]